MPLSKKKRDLLRNFVNFLCEECHKPEKEVGILEPHRIRPGRDGGKYKIRNIKMVCKRCHSLFTSAYRMARNK